MAALQVALTSPENHHNAASRAGLTLSLRRHHIPVLAIGEQLQRAKRRWRATNGDHARGRTLALVRETGLDEAFEKRVRLVRPALEFRMILAGEEERMIPQLD